VLRVRHDCVRRVQIHKHLQKMGLIISILRDIVGEPIEQLGEGIGISTGLFSFRR
jgi:hypothetical protein